MSIKLGEGHSVHFYSGSSKEGAFDKNQLMAKWEIDPTDGKSIQFRIPSESFGGTKDRIPFYVSASGKIGIGTNDPETEIELKTSSSALNSQKFGPTKISGSLNVAGDIISGDINGGSF